MENTKYDILGIGNAITDIIIDVDNKILEDLNITPGSMSLVDISFIRNILEKKEIVKTAAGGSVANTISTLAKLGTKCSFVGSRKDDDYGRLFSRSMEEDGIKLLNYEKKDGVPSSICLVLVSPNGERTMCTYLGASTDFGKDDIEETLLDDHKVIYLEGYLFDLPKAKDVFFDIIRKSKTKNYKVALSLSDSFCVDRYRKDFLELININIDLLFCNEQEIETLFETDYQSAIKEAGKKVESTVVTRGNKGAMLYKNSKLITVAAHKTKVLDTTGAGDSFAAGFLYSYLNGLPIDVCLKAGTLCASDVIKSFGARTDTNVKELFIQNNILE